jgi:hypothetical protein
VEEWVFLDIGDVLLQLVEKLPVHWRGIHHHLGPGRQEVRQTWPWPSLGCHLWSVGLVSPKLNRVDRE